MRSATWRVIDVAEWIRVEKCLPDKPEVVAIAAALGMSRDEVVGKLIRVWSWADSHIDFGSKNGVKDGEHASQRHAHVTRDVTRTSRVTSRDASRATERDVRVTCASRVTCAFIDELVVTQGFGAEMVKVGWLEVMEDGVVFPRIERHVAQSAKARELAAERARRYRNRKRHAPSRVTRHGVTRDVTRDVTRLQYKTEEHITHTNVCALDGDFSEVVGEVGGEAPVVGGEVGPDDGIGPRADGPGEGDGAGPRDDDGGSGRETWLTPYFKLRMYYGGGEADKGPMLRYIGSLRKTYTDEQLVPAYERFLKAQLARKGGMSASFFAQDLHLYAQSRQVELSDEVRAMYRDAEESYRRDQAGGG